jgi:hypothetical protein
VSYLDQDLSDAPTWVQLSDKTSTRRGPVIACCGCRDPIKPGDRYRTITGLSDGRFETSRFHAPACPRDIADDRAQYEREVAEHRRNEEREREFKRAGRGVRKPLATGTKYEPRP